MVQLQPGLFLEKLDGHHADCLATFDCGHDDSNEFIRNAALAYEQENLGRTYLLLDSEGRMQSFVTLAMGVLKVRDAELALNLRGLDKPNQLPALRIARLGTSVGSQGKGFGTLVLQAVTNIFWTVQENVGTRFIMVDAVPERVHWYSKRGFVSVFSKTDARETYPMYFVPHH